MTIPNAGRATIAIEKLTAYLLNPSHKRGGAKARLLVSLGFRTDTPRTLETALRTQHLSLETTRTEERVRRGLRDRRADYNAEWKDRPFLLDLAD